MIVAISHHVWQILRTLLRAETAGQPPLGRELRMNMSRRTKDGTFLDELVGAGLLAPVGKAPPADGKDEPVQFRTRYKLTDLGRHAAEYGEYDRPYTPRDAPLTGKFAALVATRRGVNRFGRRDGSDGSRGRAT